MPVTIRVPVGGGIGAVEHHSESNESYFCHTAGLRVVACASPADAHVMIQQAIACDDPVIFYEPKRRYWESGDLAIGPPASGDLSLDRARVVREGSAATIISYGPAVRIALDAAELAAGEGHAIEVIDLRSLSPLDLPTLVTSVAKTGRAVVVHEAPTFLGLGAEIAAAITEQCFDALEAPVLRVGGYNIPYPPSRAEDRYLPDIDRVLDAVDRVLAY